MVASIEESHKREIQDVRGSVAHLGTRVDAAEVVSASVEVRMWQLEFWSLLSRQRRLKLSS